MKERKIQHFRKTSVTFVQEYQRLLFSRRLTNLYRVVYLLPCTIHLPTWLIYDKEILLCLQPTVLQRASIPCCKVSSSHKLKNQTLQHFEVKPLCKILTKSTNPLKLKLHISKYGQNFTQHIRGLTWSLNSTHKLLVEDYKTIISLTFLPVLKVCNHITDVQ